MLIETFGFGLGVKNNSSSETAAADGALTIYEKMAVYLVLFFYIGVTVYTAYKYPIVFFGSNGDTLNTVINFGLVIISSILFWIIKIIELIHIYLNPPEIRKMKKSDGENKISLAQQPNYVENEFTEIKIPKTPKIKLIKSKKKSKISFGKKNLLKKGTKKAGTKKVTVFPKKVKSARKKKNSINYYDPIY